MNKLLPLTIGYSTLGNRAKNIKFLPSVTNLVIVQNPDSSLLPSFNAEVKVFSQWGEDGILDYLGESLDLSKPQV